MKASKKIILLLLLATALIVCSYHYFDRQLVWFLVAHQSHDWFILQLMANDIPNIIGAFVFLFYIYFAIRLTLFNPSIIDKKLMVMCNAIVISIFLKDSLKVIFGRYWANTFVCNNPSFINDQVYGFNWFTTGTAFSSFPSGHVTFMFSFATSLWFLFPSLRWLWGLLTTFVVMGQIGMHYHFMSDIIAGAVVGSLVGLCNYCYFNTNRQVIKI